MKQLLSLKNLTCFLFICVECTIYPQSHELRRFCQHQSSIIWGERALPVTHLRNIKGSVGSWIYYAHAVFDVGSLVLSCRAWTCSQIDVSLLTNRQQYNSHKWDTLFSECLSLRDGFRVYEIWSWYILFIETPVVQCEGRQDYFCSLLTQEILQTQIHLGSARINPVTQGSLQTSTFSHVFKIILMSGSAESIQ